MHSRDKSWGRLSIGLANSNTKDGRDYQSRAGWHPAPHLVRAFLLLLAEIAHAGTFTVIGSRPGAWPAILSSIGHVESPAASAQIFVARPGTPASTDWRSKVESGATLILEGSSPLAASFGFKAGTAVISTVHLVDVHNPALPVIWERPIELPDYEVSPGSRIFARERWTGAPLIAGMRFGLGSVLWVAADPGATGYERFPYLPQALSDLGVEPDFRSSRLWAFFDYSYRVRADPDYLAARWRKAGISALHVASWHFFDSDKGRDEYLRSLIEACHRHGVLVYAWIELPHVSEKFWSDHPQWREKTALLQDAQLDWRKLMNLQNADCVAAIRAGLSEMMRRFDWDGVNLAELYFESLEGAANPARLTPMNDDVRAAFNALKGWDPVEIWTKRTDAASLRQFLEFRARLARSMQEDWLRTAASFRSFHPDLDIVLTHVDDRFDTGMKDSIGADASQVLPLLEKQSFSFLIEDPATVWNLGPQRYLEIAKRYASLTPHTDKLAIDINIVDRYQDVYPTKQQTGTELFQLVHLASSAFQRVALYFENSILEPDMTLLPASSAVVNHYMRDKRHQEVDSPTDLEVVWKPEGALVDGRPWPIHSSSAVHLPAGRHTLEPASKADSIAITDLNATLRSAEIGAGKQVSFEYASESRAIVTMDRTPGRVEVDSVPINIVCDAAGPCTLLLPRGQHRVSVR